MSGPSRSASEEIGVALSVSKALGCSLLVPASLSPTDYWHNLSPPASLSSVFKTAEGHEKASTLVAVAACGVSGSPLEMSLFCLSCNPRIRPQVTGSWKSKVYLPSNGAEQQFVFAFKSMNTEFQGQRVDIGSKLAVQWSFLGGSKVVLQSGVTNISYHRKGSCLSACWITSSHIASKAFTWGTVAVLPFYTLMVLAPNAGLTKRTMENCVPYVVLGILYACLLYLSWTPETLCSMFANKYWMPELSGIAKMFSSEMTVASAWIHLLAVDLFAARQVFHDGLKNKIETRHSVSLCLLFCPIGILTHIITKVLIKMGKRSH